MPYIWKVLGRVLNKKCSVRDPHSEKQLPSCVMMMMMIMMTIMIMILVPLTVPRFIFSISISLHRLSLVFVLDGLSQYLHFDALLVTAKIFVWVYRYRTS